MKAIVGLSLMSLLLYSSPVRAQDSLGRMERLDSSMITAYHQHARGNSYVVSTQMTSRIVSTFGENDVLKAIALRPGVSQGIEGSQAFFVRGAGIGGNRIELDGVPLYRSSHLLGLTSSFPSEMISQMCFTTGGFHPASGNLSSSLTEVFLKEDIASRFRGSVSLSPFMEGAYLEAPLGSRFTARASFRISPAFALAGRLVNGLGQSANSLAIDDIGGKAYDALASFVWKPWNAITLNGYYYRTEDAFNYLYGKDDQDFSSNEEAFKIGASWNAGRWGSLSGLWYRSINHVLHQERFLWGSAKGQDTVGLSMESGTAETGVRLQYTLALFKLFSLDLGWDYSARQMDYKTHQGFAVQQVDTGVSDKSSYSISAPFAQLSLHNNRWIDARVSARFSRYALLTAERAAPAIAHDVDIHAISDFFVLGSRGIEISYDRSAQFFHVLEGLPSGWGQDLMLAGNTQFPAEHMRQVYLGVFGKEQFDKNRSLSYYAGYYWRDLSGLIGFKHASHVFGMRDEIDENDIVSGTGWSRGLEMSLSLNTPLVEAEISYTHSDTWRHYPDLNYGKPFRFRFDRPHMLKSAGSYLFFSRPAKRGSMEHRVNLVIDFSSGSLMTVSQGLVYDMFPGMPVMSEDRTAYLDLSQLNNFRLPLYFRVDAGYIYTRKWFKSELLLNASIFNVLNRHNVYQYFYEDGKWRSLSILPIMPSLRVQYSF